MRAFIFVADAARSHPDNTFSVLRGGINQLRTPSNQPIQFRGSFVARITASMTETGPHDFKIRILNEDGHQVAPEIAGSFDVREGGGAVNVVGDVGLILPKPGRYTFSLSVDRAEMATWEIRAEHAPPSSTGG